MAAENNMNVEVKHRMNNSENTVQLCGHICGMRDGRMVKKLVFGAMGGGWETRKGRREWLNDVVEWRNGNLFERRGLK